MAATNLKLPNRYQAGILSTFGRPDEVRMALPLGVKLKRIAEIQTEKFLAGKGASPLFPAQVDASRAMVDLLRQGFASLATKRGFEPHQLANRVCWYPKFSSFEDRRIAFNADGFSGSRKLLGRYKEFYWHYATSIDLAWTPPARLTASGHVIFSIDGEKILSDASVATKLRRQALRSKRNAWWRDVMLAYFSQLAGENTTFMVPMSGETGIEIRSYPVSFNSPLRLEFDSDFEEFSDDPIDETEDNFEGRIDESELIEGDEVDDESETRA
jgi:hypothetical protein